MIKMTGDTDTPRRASVARLSRAFRQFSLSAVIGAGFAGTIAVWDRVEAAPDDTRVQACSSKFINQRRASPAAAERTCSCLYERLPPDKAIEAEGVLLSPERMTKGFLADYAYWVANPSSGKAVSDCRFMGCEGRQSVDDGCDFEAAYDAEDRGDHATAIERYSRYIDAYPERPAALSNRGRSYVEMGSYDLAITDLSKAIQVMGGGNDNYRFLALAYHLVGRDNEALPIADEAINANPLAAQWCYRVRAQIHESLGHRDAAIADYREALRYNIADDQEIAREALKRLGAD